MFMPNLYIISGANGSGKITRAKQILPRFLNVYEYLNADEIAAGLSPFRPESVAIQAGKLMVAIDRVQQLVASGGHNIPEETIVRRYYREQKTLTVNNPLIARSVLRKNRALTTTIAINQGKIYRKLNIGFRLVLTLGYTTTFTGLFVRRTNIT